ncbi:MAG TPA: pyruvate kinase [Acidiferrobacteraceae bacterium]|nr:pyruvate kinase [Acidiferrobacteraceae bacterium]HEX20060.1 pyruvate kinase [Acidiferrobacteraceae bacterium]
MPRRTKIVATLGPATDVAGVLDKLIEIGVDTVRMNLSHDTHKIHKKRADLVHDRAQAHGRPVGILVDLQGPKIRVGKFKNKQIILKEGDEFILDVDMDLDAGTQERVGVTYKELHNDVSRGATLLLDDGRIVLWVEKVEGNEIHCRVTIGGPLSNNKGINRQGGGLSATALTGKDREDIKFAAELDADYLAVSFPRTADDVNEARELFRAAGGKGGIVAKIERAEAIDEIESILEASDAIMVARGDLGVEIGDAAVPPIQKRLIKLARSHNIVVITATQMMESMIESPIPTRAEVSDVANAVIDGTDAIMLSAETAAGKYPVEAVQAMDRVCLVAEQTHEVTHSEHRMEVKFKRIDEAIAMATMYSANHLPVRAIASLTESGSTALWMSRISSGVPIYALTPHVETRRKVTLYRGVYPVGFELPSNDPAEVMQEAVDELRRRGAVRDGDIVVITIGEPLAKPGGTNTMKIVTVGEIITDE